MIGVYTDMDEDSSQPLSSEHNVVTATATSSITTLLVMEIVVMTAVPLTWGTAEFI